MAAAATGVGMLMKSAPPEEKKPPVEFIADRPFIYLVRDNASGLIVFIGHVEKL
ncbi:MAG: hypothetical protein LBT89_07350 [Planctomycetaceae bacterium]|nr:hypothetical protein [Planctomycetaceae bacterium]